MKYLIYTLVAFVAVVTTGCYEDYEQDFAYTAVYFPYQQPMRTVLVDETEVKVGIVLGGKRTNEVNEYAYLSLATDLIEDQGVTMLPSTHYTLDLDSDSLVTIPVGSFQGDFSLNFTEAFFDDPNSIGSNYVLPLRIKQYTTDSVLAGKHYTMAMFKYINNYHGTYYRAGLDSLDDSENGVVYYRSDTLELNINTDLVTTGRNTLSYSDIGLAGALGALELTVEESGNVTAVVTDQGFGSLTISSFSGTFNNGVLNLSYWYNYNGVDRKVTETLTFRDNGLTFEQWE
ncbi:MAG: DUF1735 domain-containing protein [Reichenbachiella sp.]